LLSDLQSGQTDGLDIKKLRGRDDIFRARKGKIRIIYRGDENARFFVLAIERRNETTYKI
jgi:mRNA-degrading endonuclease RelE of RelBE toxin-antitoxin system